MVREHQLREFPLLKDLDEIELIRLSGVMKERRAPKGSYVVYEDDPGPSIMFLHEGDAKVTLVNSEGKEIVLSTFGRGDFFGEISVITGEERSANVVATSDCVLFVLAAEDFKAHISENSGLALQLLKELAQRLRASSRKIGDLALFDVYRRVARTLESIGEPDDDGNLIIAKRPTHQELANMVGTSREMVTRALKGLEEDSCIEIESRRIIFKKMPH
jgi:CRP/FNR family cyclic AMP-dependent transcriptional regulator